jgi:hypothetical protein
VHNDQSLNYIFIAQNSSGGIPAATPDGWGVFFALSCFPFFSLSPNCKKPTQRTAE